MQSQEVIDLVCGFVDKSGGLEKVEQGMKALQRPASTPGGCSKFLANLSRSRSGSDQLVAAAMMGFVMAALIYRSVHPEPGAFDEPQD